jgi:catechol 2,3-dioxygenase-like lactoylglutathione lyase family enzyme
MMISPLIRAALMVRDMERSLRFYRDLLGLTEVHLPAVDLSATISWRLLGWPAPAALRATILKAPGAAGSGPNYGMLGLFEVPASPAGETAATRSGLEAGESAVVFYCADMARILAELGNYGGRIIGGPATFAVAGSTIRPVTEIILRDPDGFAVNLIETDPARAYETAPVAIGG